MSKVILQDLYLNALRRDRIPVTLFTTNGYKIQGTIVSFDQFTILIVTPSGQNLVFKHAISTVIPARPVQFAPGTFDTTVEVNDTVSHAKNPSAPREDRS